MALTSADLLQYIYYRCLPAVYREEDAQLGLPLYRYLQSITFGGVELVLTDIENLITLVDPEKCPEKFFPALYQCFGLEYFPDVDIKYHRRFLMNYGELKRRRGTYSCVRFLVRVLTSLNCKLRYLRGTYQGQKGRHLIIDLQARTIDDILNMENNANIISKFLGLFLPYYITVQVEGEIEIQQVSTTYYHGNFLTVYKSYTLRPESARQDNSGGE